MSEPARRYRFDASRRLHGRRAFAAVFEAGVKKHAGPLTVFGGPNGLDHPRLGLSVPRRVGTAVRRNRVKRLIREAFRVSQHVLPGSPGDPGGPGEAGGAEGPAGYDLVVVVRPHETATLAEYQRLLSAAVRSIHQVWQRRDRRDPPTRPREQ